MTIAKSDTSLMSSPLILPTKTNYCIQNKISILLRTILRETLIDIGPETQI